MIFIISSSNFFMTEVRKSVWKQKNENKLECFCRLKCLLNICRVREYQDERGRRHSTLEFEFLIQKSRRRRQRRRRRKRREKKEKKTIYRGNDIIVPCLLFLFIQKHFSSGFQWDIYSFVLNAKIEFQFRIKKRRKGT